MIWKHLEVVPWSLCLHKSYTPIANEPSPLRASSSRGQSSSSSWPCNNTHALHHHGSPTIQTYKYARPCAGVHFIWRQEVWCRPSLGHLMLNKSQFALYPACLTVNHHDHAITHMHCVKGSIYIWRQDVWRGPGHGYLTLNKHWTQLL